MKSLTTWRQQTSNWLTFQDKDFGASYWSIQSNESCDYLSLKLIPMAKSEDPNTQLQHNKLKLQRIICLRWVVSLPSIELNLLIKIVLRQSFADKNRLPSFKQGSIGKESRESRAMKPYTLFLYPYWSWQDMTQKGRYPYQYIGRLRIIQMKCCPKQNNSKLQPRNIFWW